MAKNKTTTPVAPVAPVKAAPSTGGTTGAYNRLTNLGDFAHPPAKKKGKKK